MTHLGTVADESHHGLDGSLRADITDEFVERLRELIAANIAGSTQVVTRFSDFIQEAIKAVSSDPAGQRTDANASSLGGSNSTSRRTRS